MAALATPMNGRILTNVARVITVAGMILPAAYVTPILLARIDGFFGGVNLLVWMSDAALLLIVPWVMLAVILIILRARELPQRFWIVFFINGFLAYLSLPIYRMHFGLYR